MQTALASAASSAEVAALAESLATAQADLAELLAANNVYTGDLVINSASTLTAAEAQGGKLGIINGNVYITQSSTAIDASKLQTVVSKIVTVIGAVSYTHSGTGVTAVNFDKLTGAGSINLDQNAPVSLPELASSGVVVIKDNGTKVTAVSAPKLATVTSLSDGSGAGTFEFDSATELNLASLVRYSAALTLKTKSTGTIDLSAFTTADTEGKQYTGAGYLLTINGPKVVTLSQYETGTLTTDAATLTLPKMKVAPTLTAANLEELHMHNLMGPINLTGFNQLETLDIIGTYLTTGDEDVVKGVRATNVTLTDAASLTDLTLAGALGTVSISGASNLTTVSTSGGMRSFSLTGATDLTSLTLGHGPNASSTKKLSNLIISGATNLASLTADSINNASILTITDNPALAKISLAALKAVGTESTAAGSVSVTITNNDLTAQSVQLPSPADYTPATAGKITTDSGITELKTYLDVAIATTDEKVKVSFDNVTEFVDYLGEKTNADSNTTDVQYTIATGNVQDIDTATDAGWVMINTYPGTAAPASIKETRTYVMAAANTPVGDSFLDAALVDEDLLIYADGIDHSFNGGTGDGEYPTMTALVNAINAYDFGNTSVTAARDAQKVLNSRLSYTKSGVATSITNITAGDKFIFKLGSATRTYTLPANTSTSLDGIDMTELGTIIANTMSGTVNAGVKYYMTAASGVVATTALITNSILVDYGNITYPALSIVVTNTDGYQSLGASTNTVAAMTASSVAIGASNVTVNGLRITLQNDSFTTAFDANDNVSNDNGWGTITTVVSGTHTYGNSSWVIPFSSAVDNSAGGDAAGVVDATAWL